MNKKIIEESNKATLEDIMVRYADPTYKYEALQVVHMKYPIKLKYWFKYK